MKASRGLKQCDSLSSLHFVLVGNVSSSIKGWDKGFLEVFKVGKERVHIFHLQFSYGYLLLLLFL